ncbi:hypothetical protein TYRP_001395 [Tyrophagus putrescentiae]|nr:hypothetical protein TYRP_001395 [Tyrophagus putrescentiae]
MTLIACYWNGGQCLHSADRGSIQKILSGNIWYASIEQWQWKILIDARKWEKERNAERFQSSTRCSKKEEMDAGQAKERDNATGNVIGNGKNQSRSN